SLVPSDTSEKSMVSISSLLIAIAVLLVIVHDLYVFGITLFLVKAYSPLIVDPDAPLTFSFSLQSFQPVSWRDTQLLNHSGRVQLHQLTPCRLLHIERQAPYCKTRKYSRCFLVRKALYHTRKIPLPVNNVKRYAIVPG